jgi:hypothetical protein
MDRAKFFDGVRQTMFGRHLEQRHVDGIEAIFNEWNAQGLTDTRWLAYIIGTAFHESAGTMQPVREALASSDERAIAILDNAWKKGLLPQVKTPYWRPDADGKSWFGRGLVQITFKSNYEKFGLVDHPERALELPVAVKVIILGMKDGLFTGHKLADYFNTKGTDWLNARRIVNSMDRAELVATYAKRFYDAIQAAL